MKKTIWNPWHGCRKLSEGCQNCYVYYFDGERRKNASQVYRVKDCNFYYPIRRDKRGDYKVKSGEMIYVCLTSDFFLEEADAWRKEAWDIIRMRTNVGFVIITKRVARVLRCLPNDWGDGWGNVWLHATAENQRRADERLPILLSLPFKHKGIVVAPFIERVSLGKYLSTGAIEQVSCGGENYRAARPLNYDWVKQLSMEYRAHDVTFTFFETGQVFVKEGEQRIITNKLEQARYALSLGLDYQSTKVSAFHLQKQNNYAQGELFESLASDV